MKINHEKKYIAFLLFSIILSKVYGQEADSTKEELFSIHAQTTVITQYKPSFPAKYTGANSLIPQAETQRSVTSTLFLGTRLWQGASFFINPEIAGGSGLSGSMGVGASTNGETYRVGDPAPQFELARLFLRQSIPLNNHQKYQESDFNEFGGKFPTNYLSFTIGKISLPDYFDLNKYSHDPRTQFMSWALMDNGAWDFAANTKGYTPSIIFEFVSPADELSYGFSLVATTANGMIMNWKIDKAGSHTLEYTHNYFLGGKNGKIRLLSYFTKANMGNYEQSIALNPTLPDITATRKNGNTKFGFSINAEQSLTKNMGAFLRAGWNDGKNETWAFTEIDRTLSAGISTDGRKWNRKDDTAGLAYVISGLSTPHRNYLKAGGRGFELGDGKLNYGLEQLAEFYYSFELKEELYLSGAYQFIVNPGYNKDRGPVNVFSVRVRIEI